MRVVDRSVVNSLATSDRGVDVSESVEAVIAALVRRQTGSEELRILGTVLCISREATPLEVQYAHVILTDHVLDWSFDRVGLHGVDGAPGQTQETITGALDELIRNLVGNLNGLVLNGKTSDSDNVCTDSTTGR